MERIRLTKTEKHVLLHVSEKGCEMPRTISLVSYHYALSVLQEKGLVNFKTEYEKVVEAKLTIKGTAYLEQNPNLKNPIDLKGVITLVASIITAVATTVAVFIACNVA